MIFGRRSKRQTGRQLSELEAEDREDEVDQAILKLGTKASLLLGLHGVDGVDLEADAEYEDVPVRFFMELAFLEEKKIPTDDPQWAS